MIDQRAIVDPGARLGTNVSVGPFSIIERDVTIGDDSWIGPHVVVKAGTRIGRSNRIFQFCSIGDAPQHLGYQGEPTVLEIGDHNIVREYCTINRGTESGGGTTRIGHHNFLMAYVHVAHDCQLGSHTIFANCASLAGHVAVGDYAIMGGFTLVHQFCRVGAHCITGIGSVCLQDVPPFVVAAGNRAVPHGINVKGLRRRDFTEDDICELKRAYKTIYRSGLSLQDALTELQSENWSSPAVAELASFMHGSQRGIIR